MATMCGWLTANPHFELKDLFDDCDWCKEKSKYTQPVDIGEWYVKCKRVPKPLWFNHKQLGRSFSSSVYLTKDKWIYTKMYGWVYKLRAYDNHYYIHKHGWVYIGNSMLYSYKTKQWYDVDLFDKHELMSVE